MLTVAVLVQRLARPVAVITADGFLGSRLL
jgi:hypothetical protein